MSQEEIDSVCVRVSATASWMRASETLNCAFPIADTRTHTEPTSVREASGVEAYQDQKNQIKEQIQDQNRAVDQQTTAAAMGAGFIRMGSKFVKTSAAGGMGAVDAYNFMDADRAINDAFGASGYQELSGAALVNFLKNSNDAEVDAFFTVQKLRLKRASEIIFGTGTQETRSKSRDVKDLGTLAMWIGAGPDSNQGSLMTRGAGSAGAAANLNLIGGFGELGEYGARPSGVPFGFYVQLSFMGDMLSKQDAAFIENAGKTALKNDHSSAYAAAAGAGMAGIPAISSAITQASSTGNFTALYNALGSTGSNMMISAGFGEVSNAIASTPVGTFLNQFNVAVMTANSAYNMQYGSKVLGIDSGRLLEANVLASIKQPMIAAGNAMVFAGVATGWTGVGIALAGIGAGLSALGNSIQVNATTGERSSKMTDQAAVSTAVGIGTAALGGAAAGASAAAASAQAAATGAQAGSAAAVAAQSAAHTAAVLNGFSQVSGVVGAGIMGGMRYDANGMSQGWSMMSSGGDLHGEMLAFDMAVASITLAAGAKMPTVSGGTAFGRAMSNSLANAGVAAVLNVASEYGKQQMYGADHSGYGQLQAGPDLTRLFGLAGSAAVAGYQADYIDTMQQKAKEENNKRQAAAIIQGLGYKTREEFEAAFKNDIFKTQKASTTDAYLSQLEKAGVDVTGLRTWVLEQRAAGVHDLTPGEMQGIQGSSSVRNNVALSAQYDLQSAIMDFDKGAPNVSKDVRDKVIAAYTKYFLDPSRIDAETSRVSNAMNKTWDDSTLHNGNIISYGGQEGLIVQSTSDSIRLQLRNGTILILARSGGMLGDLNAAGESIDTGPRSNGGKTLLTLQNQMDQADRRAAGFHNILSANDTPGASFVNQMAAASDDYNQRAMDAVKARAAGLYFQDVTGRDKFAAGASEFMDHFGFGFTGDIYAAVRSQDMGWAESMGFKQNFENYQKTYSNMANIAGWAVDAATTVASFGGALAAKAGLKLAIAGANMAAKGGFFAKAIGSGLTTVAGALGVLRQGTVFEQVAQGFVKHELGEQIIKSQYRVGFTERGFDFLSVSGKGSNAKLILNEVKDFAGVVPDKKFSAFGVNRARSLTDNLAEASNGIERARLSGQIDKATADALTEQLRDRTATIRLIGNTRGTQFTQSSITKIQQATKMQVTDQLWISGGLFR